MIALRIWRYSKTNLWPYVSHGKNKTKPLLAFCYVFLAAIWRYSKDELDVNELKTGQVRIQQCTSLFLANPGLDWFQEQKGSNWSGMFARRACSEGLANDMSSLFVGLPFKNKRFWSRSRCSIFRVATPTCTEVALSTDEAEGLSRIGVCRVIISPGLVWGKHFETCVEELGLLAEVMSCLVWNDDSLKTAGGDFRPWQEINRGTCPMLFNVSLFTTGLIVIPSCLWQLLFSGRVWMCRALFLSNALLIFSRSLIWGECSVLRTLGSLETEVAASGVTALVRFTVCPLFLFVIGCLKWLCTCFLENIGIVCALVTKGRTKLPDTVRSESAERKTRLLVKRGTKGVSDCENNGVAMVLVLGSLTAVLFTLGDCLWKDFSGNVIWDAAGEIVACLVVSCVRWTAKGLQWLNWGGAVLVKLPWFAWVACWSLFVG